MKSPEKEKKQSSLLSEGRKKKWKEKGRREIVLHSNRNPINFPNRIKKEKKELLWPESRNKTAPLRVR